MDPITLAMGLAQFAPQVIKWVTGSDKAATAAEHIVGIAEAVTGAKGDAALKAIQTDPNLALQFRQAVLASEADLDKAYLADRQSARARDIEYIHAGQHNYRADIMVLGATLGLIACLVVLVYFRQGLPGEVVGILSTISGLFGACLRDAFQFEFGSSRSSRDKDDTISKLTKV